MGYKVLRITALLYVCPYQQGVCAAAQFAAILEVLTSDLPSHQNQCDRRHGKRDACGRILAASVLQCPSRRWSGISINSFYWSLMTKMSHCRASWPPLLSNHYHFQQFAMSSFRTPHKRTYYIRVCTRMYSQVPNKWLYTLGFLGDGIANAVLLWNTLNNKLLFF